MRIRFLKAVVAGAIIPVLFSIGTTGFPQQRKIRREVAIVNITFSALDKHGMPVTGLSAGDFSVFENGEPQEIEFFSETAKSDEVVLTIALLIDTSGSVKDKLRYEIDTAAEFFKEILRPSKDLALIIQFDSEVNLVQDFTQDQKDLMDALNSIRAGGNTALYDAVYLAAEEKLRYEAGRKVMVVISDGEDTASLVSRDEALEAAQKSNALIYGIGVRGKGSLGGFGDLKEFAEQTGGAFFSPRAEFKDIQETFRKIGIDIKGQYSLAYVPTDKRKDGTFRRIEIHCNKSDVRIRARRGYYAPEREQ